MRPMNAWYTVHATGPEGDTTTSYQVTDAGIPTTFGLLTWHDTPAPGHFGKGSIGIVCNGDGTGYAINGEQNFDVTCAKIL